MMAYIGGLYHTWEDDAGGGLGLVKSILSLTLRANCAEKMTSGWVFFSSSGLHVNPRSYISTEI